MSSPRVEAQITWNGDFFQTGVGVNLWVDGSYQNTERNYRISCNEFQKQLTSASETTFDTDDNDDVDSAGVGFGTKLTYEGFSLVASGFYGTAMGMRGQHSTGDHGAAGATGSTCWST